MMAMRRPWLLPLVPLYAAGVAWKSRGFAQHSERSQRLAEPVVSVGSLSAGGAGKTPFVIALAEAIRRAGYGMDVLTRGHGRTSTGDLRVRPDGDADEFGDEPLLLARQLACPVYVARERFRAGEMAERDRRVRRDDRHLSLHLLDDGFQHRQLARAVDIVLFTAEDAADTLLPAGNLREPLRAMRRADIVVLRSEEAASLQPVLDRVFAGHSAPKVWIVDRQVAVVEGPAPQRPFAFCGIARPDGFRSALQSLGMELVRFLALRDHQRYDAAMVRELTQQATAARAHGFVTTAKDAIKLSAAMRQELAQIGPLTVCDVRVHLHDEARCMSDMISLIEAGWKRRLAP
ncbi:MAG: tetraacyldisaccharide 4'-kinase [Janthinobacterium lividum]